MFDHVVYSFCAGAYGTGSVYTIDISYAQTGNPEMCIRDRVSPSDPANGGTTHPEIVAGILEYLKENGFKNSMILEGSWVGDRTADAFEVCGYRQLCEDYDVEF